MDSGHAKAVLVLVLLGFYVLFLEVYSLVISRRFQFAPLRPRR